MDNVIWQTVKDDTPVKCYWVYYIKINTFHIFTLIYVKYYHCTLRYSW